MSSVQGSDPVASGQFLAAKAIRPNEATQSPGQLYATDLIRTHGLFALVREDFSVHHRQLTMPGFQAMAAYRYGTWTRTVRFSPLRKILRILYWSLYVFCRNVYGIEIYDTVRIGRRLALGHQHGIVVHPDVTIGDDCVIRHGVTLGAAGAFRRMEAPQLGNRVDIGANATIMGPVRIGSDVRVGPNTVVQSDIPAGSTVFAQSPRIISGVKRRTSQESGL